MDEQLKSHLKNNIKTEVTVKKKQQIEYVLQGTLKSQRGHSVWEIDEETGTVSKATYKKTTAVFGAIIPKEELIVKLGCIYIPALNSENAKRKYTKNKNQSSYFISEPKMKLSDCFF